MCRPFRDASACLISWMDNSEKPSSSHISPSTGRDSVPALEVPLGNLQYHEDEMLSWLQYPMEDSFDKNYCAEDLHIEALASHSNFVHNTFSNLSIKEGEEFHSTGLRMQTSLPSDLKLREREGAGSSAYMASHARDVTAGYNANRGERVLAANTAMAIGAHRAAGLLFHSGAETFNKVRTHAQPHSAKRVQSALATQESGRGASNLAPHTFKAGDEKHRIQPPVQHLTNPNFPLFSRAAGSLQQDKLGIGAQGKGKDSASKGERKGRVASPMSHAHPTPMALATSSEAFSEPAISKGFSLCFPQPSATRMTGMGFSRAPLQCEARWQPSTAHLKDTAFTPYADSTKRSSISCKLRAEAVSMTPVEETTKASGSHRAKEGLPSFSATASAGLASGSVIGSSGVALLKIETKERHLTPEKGKPSSGVKSTIPTDVESSIHSELACHDSERNLNKKSELCRVKEFYSGSCPLITVSSLTTSESKVWETVERADIVMASPSGDISEKSIEEAAAFTMKRKADFAEDDEVESKHFKDEKLSQGSANVAKRTRAVEIHNLSERKRRDKINLKMKELQDLIPNANKTDKASVLDEAIEYVKLLQSQVQSMSLRTGMAGLPMLLPPGMPSSPVQQRLQPPHLNLDRGAGSGFRMDVDVFEHPCNVSGLPLASLHAGVREAHGHLQGFRESEAYELLPAQLRQQHLHSNMHTNADMFVAGTIQKEQRASRLQLPAHTTSNDDMQ